MLHTISRDKLSESKESEEFNTIRCTPTPKQNKDLIVSITLSTPLIWLEQNNS